MKKEIIIGTSLIAVMAFNGVNLLPPVLSEHIVHADTKVVVKNYAFYVKTGDETFLSTKDGQLVVWKTNVNATPAADVTITKSNGTKLGPFDPASEQQTGNWIKKGELETGDIIEIIAKQDWKNYTTPPLSLSITTGNKIKLGVNSAGSLEIVSTGGGQAQVTYNVNTANPDDPTANPDFTVLIPTEYQLSNKQKVSVGAVALKDAKDVTQNYTGDKAIKVTVASAKNFQFDNGGTYKLVGWNKADIPAEIALDKTSTSSEVNAQLTKEGSKTAASDCLTFNWSILDEINIPDLKLKKLLNKAIDSSRQENQKITLKEITKIGTFPDLNGQGITKLNGIEYLNPDKLSKNSDGVVWIGLANNPNLHDLSPMMNLLNKRTVPSTFQLNLLNSGVYDLSVLDGIQHLSYHDLSQQQITENKQTVKNGKLTVKVLPIKEVDGSTPEIIPENGGVYDEAAGTITWSGLDKNTSSVSYSWKGKEYLNEVTQAKTTFTGKVKVPIEF